MDSNMIYPQQAGQISRTNLPTNSAKNLYNTLAPLKSKMARVTPEGLRFLKCAFAPADFDGSSLYGVPDDFGGKSLAIKHRGVNSDTFAAAVDTYYVIAPVPGIAYYKATVTAGAGIVAATLFNPVFYSDFNSIFPTSLSMNDNTSKFRIVSNHFELVNTTNNNTWTGNIQCFKLNLQMYLAAPAAALGDTSSYSVVGLKNINANNEDMYSGAFNFGVYSGAFNRGAKFDFSQVLRAQSGLPEVLQTTDFGQLVGQISGFDNNMETIVIKISGVTGATNTALLRSWSCVEYQFNPGNVMYISQQMHANCDQLALEIYKQVSLQLPAGVSALDNENFWERVLGIISSMGLAGAVLPGPYGLASGSIGGLSMALKQLLF